MASQDSARSTVQEPRDQVQQTRNSSRESKQQGARKFSVQESRRLTASQGSSQQGPSREISSQDTVDMRSESQNRSRQVSDEDEKTRRKRPHESSSPSTNPHQDRPSVICSAQMVAKSSASARSASAASVLHERSNSGARDLHEMSASAATEPHERSTSAARQALEDNVDIELSSLSALLNSQVPLSLPPLAID